MVGHMDRQKIWLLDGPSGTFQARAFKSNYNEILVVLVKCLVAIQEISPTMNDNRKCLRELQNYQILTLIILLKQRFHHSKETLTTIAPRIPQSRNAECRSVLWKIYTVYRNYSQNGPNPKRPRTKRPKSETAQSKTAQIFWSKRPNLFFLSEMGLVSEFH